jgi:hypothetical protein
MLEPPRELPGPDDEAMIAADAAEVEPKEPYVAFWEMRPGQPSPRGQTLADFAVLIGPDATYGATASLLMNVFEPTAACFRPASTAAW